MNPHIIVELKPKLSERPTPETDLLIQEVTILAPNGRFALTQRGRVKRYREHARDLERRLAVAVEALEFYAKTDHCDIAQMTLREISKEKTWTTTTRNQVT